MPSISQFEYVIAVDTHRHFARAARACHVTQPTLSMQIQKLEEELDIRIFDRSKKPIVATDVGARFIQQARHVVHEFKKILALTEQDRGVISGNFTLAVIPTLSAGLIPLFVQTFAEKFPLVDLTIREMQTSLIIEALEREEIDAGLLATPLRVPGITEDILFYEPFYLYANLEHPLAKKSTIRENDLSSDIWLLEEGHCFRNQVMQLCDSKKRKPKLKNVNFASGNIETLMQLVDRNVGYTLVPELYLNLREHGSEEIKVVRFERPIPSREISLIYRRVQLKRKIIDGLKDVIVDTLPQRLKKLKKSDLDVLPVNG